MDLKFLEELNDNQREAVVYNDGASLVIAGAGSGKTRVLTYKIAYLLKQGLAPNSILALTFTNKAAREMKERIAAIVGPATARHLWMGTFHSIFSRILRTEASVIDGYDGNFTVYDAAASKSLIKLITKDLKLDEKIYRPGALQSRISFAKNNLISPQSYASDTNLLEADKMAKLPLMKEIYRIYCFRCKQANAMDFDDLLFQTNLLFRNNPNILLKYQNVFKFILVDEYQDTNFAQYLIVKKLAELHKRICVVGDDAQSIYSFRGANIDNILQFKTNYPNAKIFKLEQNYRSTQTIVNAANSLIKKNAAQIQKNVFSEKAVGEPIKVMQLVSDLDEADFVTQKLALLSKNENISHKNFAVLYRTNAQSRVLEESFRKKNIPYKIYGGLSFYQRKEIKDLLAYFRFVSNTKDEDALRRIINYPLRGIGETSQNKLFVSAELHGVDAWEVLSDILKYNLEVNAGTATKMAKFRNMILPLHEKVDVLNAYDLAELIVKASGLLSDTFLTLSPENTSKRENIEELLKGIHEFCENKQNEGEEGIYLRDYLAEVSLLTDQDTQNGEEQEKVTLMTVHAAKGLEFRVVFIVGLEEELFPSLFSMDSERSLEEERRLFYVAITRAEELCFFSYAQSRFRNGKSCFLNPSRFLKEVDTRYLDLPDALEYQEPSTTGSWDQEVSWERKRFVQKENSFKAKRTESQVVSPLEPRNLKKINSGEAKKLTQNEAIPVGAYVKHAVFGVGKVIETSIVSGNEKAEIDFGEKGKKSLLLKFAKLELLK